MDGLCRSIMENWNEMETKPCLVVTARDDFIVCFVVLLNYILSYSQNCMYQKFHEIY